MIDYFFDAQYYYFVTLPSDSKVKYMQKIYSLLIFLSIISYGQQGRVGINTDYPEATLDIKEKPLDEMPEGYAQGVSFPNFTTKERKTFTEVKLGTMIYNTTKNRLEIYTLVNGKEGWYSVGVVEEEPLSTKTVSAADIAQKQKIMFQDDEPESVLFDGNQRGFYLNAMLQVSKIDRNKFRIRNFLPRKFNDVEIYFKNDKTTAPIKILVLEELAALAEVEIDLPFDGGSLRFEDEDGNAESYAASDLKTDDYTLSVDVPDNFLFHRMKTIKNKTFISFGKYGTGNWGTTTAEHIRLYLPILANMAYLYSSEKFRTRFMDFPHVLYDNGKKPINREAVYQSMLSVPRQVIGVTTGVEGLGGGSAFGIHQRFLTNDDYYSQLSHWPLECWAHEFGHVIGFSHDSNMTYRGGTPPSGYVDIVIRLYGDLLRNGDIPFWKNPYR